MPPGNYYLQIKAQYSYNTTSPYILKVPFSIRPPFYKTIWFICVCAAVFSILIYGLYRYRVNHILKLQTIRNKIARDLHDEVGATLSGISMYTHLTKEQINQSDNAGVEKSLSIIQQNAGEMVNKLNDIVWLVNPEQDSLQKLVQRLEEYAFEMAGVKNMQVKINLPADIGGLQLAMDIRRNIFLFCKEAINNAVKYSCGNLLRLDVKLSGSILEFSVSDNGTGFNTASVKKGNGLGNMQKRAAEIGAEFSLQAVPGKGSAISIQVRIT
jgi:signal transduction histidine kinase